MFEVGFLELVIIGVVALLVFGPERLPDLARNVGRWVGHARQVVWSVRSEIERELQAPDLQRLNQSIDSSRIERWLERGGQTSLPRHDAVPNADRGTDNREP